jgi:hypothetical protein
MDLIIARTQTLFTAAAVQVYERLVGILPEALLAILTVMVGWIVASVVYSVIVRVLAFFAVDKLVAKTPLDKMLRGIGIGKSATEIIGLLFFWLTILVTLVLASEILRLPQVSAALAVVTSYIPQVIAAFLILIFGMLLARFLQTVVTQSLSDAEIGYERTIGKGVQVTVLIFVVLAAVEQLGLNLSFITTNVILLVASVLLIIGLSVVVGARTVMENILACQRLRRDLAPGMRIRIADLEGTIREFTIAGVMLDTSGGRTVVPATHFFTHTYTLLQSS